MFNWFNRKAKSPSSRARDLVWPTAEAKWKALPSIITDNQPALVYGWFPDTIKQAQNIIAKHNLQIPVHTAQKFLGNANAGKTIILLEHYPLIAAEAELLASPDPKEILVLSALDEPLFLRFGGERISALMQNMGMETHEMIEHKLITSSIQRAQEKLAEKVSSDFSANSQDDWFRWVGV